MKSALFVVILSLCSVANAAAPDLPVVGVNTNNLRAAVGSGYGGAPGYIATVDLDGSGVYDGFVQDAQRIYGNIPVGTYLSSFRLDPVGVSHAGANWVDTFKVDNGTPGNDFWGFNAAGVCSLFPHSLCVHRNDNINDPELYATNAGAGDRYWNAFDYRIPLARYLYCANLDAMLNCTNNGFGMHYIMTDEWTPGGMWGPCDLDNSLYLTFATEISDVLHDHDIAHVLNCGITLGIDADGPITMSRANFLYLCKEVDGLTFEHPCDDDVITSTNAVNNMLDYLSYAAQSGVCTVLFPGTAGNPHGQSADFTAALAMYVQGPLVGWTQSFDPSWSNWPTTKGRRTSAIRQFVNGSTHYAYYSNGWWLTINFGNFTYNLDHHRSAPEGKTGGLTAQIAPVLHRNAVAARHKLAIPEKTSTLILQGYSTQGVAPASHATARAKDSFAACEPFSIA